MSRRAADAVVDDGRVTINGETAVAGSRLQPGDVVKLDGRAVNWEHLNVLGDGQVGMGASDDGELEGEERFVYIKYWKPRGVTCTTDPSVRDNIVRRVNHPSARVFMVGRLDKDSSGLILLTSDGRVPNAVLRAKENHAKVYQVTTRYDLYEEELQQLRDGVVITTLAQRDGRRAQELTAPTLPCEVEWGPYANTVLITLREGRNRQIRKMLEAIGNEVVDLHRVEVMGIGLDGLPREDVWKDLSEREMAYVRNAINISEKRRQFSQ